MSLSPDTVTSITRCSEVVEHKVLSRLTGQSTETDRESLLQVGGAGAQVPPRSVVPVSFQAAWSEEAELCSKHSPEDQGVGGCCRGAAGSPRTETHGAGLIIETTTVRGAAVEFGMYLPGRQILWAVIRVGGGFVHLVTAPPPPAKS